MSNFAAVQIDVIDPQTNFGILSSVVAEIVKIVKVEQGYTIVALRDFTGVENTALIRGRSKPTYAEIGQVKVFALSGKNGTRGTQYSGFYNPQDPIPPEFAGKKPPAPVAGASAGQGGGYSGGGGKGNYADGKNRGFALSYAKDLVVAGKVDIKQITGCTNTFTSFLDTGQWPSIEQPQQVQQPVEQEIQAPIEQEVQEMGEQKFIDAVNQDPYGAVPGAGGPSFVAPVQQPAQQVVQQPQFKDEDIPF